MWIKVVYCTKDTIYAKRLGGFLDKEYGNKIEISICSSMESVLDFFSQYKVDLALFGDEFEREVLDKRKEIPCIFALMVEQLYESDETDGSKLKRIDKYQRGDNVYKDILQLYSSGSRVKYIHTGSNRGSSPKMYVFTSAEGGCGTSSVARAYARRCAAYEKVLYLDLGLFSNIEIDDGNKNGLDEIVLALKSRRNILPLKLMSAVSAMQDRVYTYGPCVKAVDLLELNAEDIHQMIMGITALGEYQKVVIDVGTAISFKEIEWMKNADIIIYVSDGSADGSRKYERFCNFMEYAGQREHMRLNKKIYVFRNKVRQESEREVWSFSNRLIGWAPYVAKDSCNAVVERIAQSDSFSNLEMENEE